MAIMLLVFLFISGTAFVKMGGFPFGEMGVSVFRNWTGSLKWPEGFPVGFPKPLAWMKPYKYWSIPGVCHSWLCSLQRSKDYCSPQFCPPFFFCVGQILWISMSGFINSSMKHGSLFLSCGYSSSIGMKGSTHLLRCSFV